MKRFSLLSFLLLILLSVSVSKFLSKSYFDTKLKQTNKDITKISNAILKKFLANKDFYIIDTREMTTIAEGYISNCILLPTSLFAWMSTVVPDNANVIIITDEENKETTLNKVIELNKYKIYGYGIYNDFVKSSFFNIEKIEYDPNTKLSIQYIVQTGGNIIDIREKNEYEETGVIQAAKLIPLSTFQKNYSKIPNEGNVYVFCKSGMRAVVGMSYAKRAGFTNKFIIMKGGMNKAIQENYPLVPYSG